MSHIEKERERFRLLKSPMSFSPSSLGRGGRVSRTTGLPVSLEKAIL